MGVPTILRRAVATALVIAPLAAAAHRAEALERDRNSGGSVTACSRYGNGCYTAPVRSGPLGPEMRLKGGTWIDCEGSCIDTLREKTVDFWETERERKGGNQQ